MKKLTAEETGWIDMQLKRIKGTFPEFYAEIFDHIVSAIELKINNGDSRGMEQIYDQVITDDFNGYKGIWRNAIQHFTAARSGWWNVLILVIKKNGSIKLTLSLALALTISFLPLQKRMLNEIMMCVSFMLACIPFTYSIYRFGLRKIFKNATIKTSSMVTFAMYPIYLFNVPYIIVFKGIKLIFDETFSPFNFHPAVAATIMVCILVYIVCFIQFYNQEFKKSITV